MTAAVGAKPCRRARAPSLASTSLDTHAVTHDPLLAPAARAGSLLGPAGPKAWSPCCGGCQEVGMEWSGPCQQLRDRLAPPCADASTIGSRRSPRAPRWYQKSSSTLAADAKGIVGRKARPRYFAHHIQCRWIVVRQALKERGAGGFAMSVARTEHRRDVNLRAQRKRSMLRYHSSINPCLGMSLEQVIAMVDALPGLVASGRLPADHPAGGDRELLQEASGWHSERQPTTGLR